MASLHETLSDQFYDWELRGRGWTVWTQPVSPEPPFRPFHRHFRPDAPAITDDGHRPTFLSSLVARLTKNVPDSTPSIEKPEPEEEPEPLELFREPLVELQTSLPAKLDISNEAFSQFLRNLSHCRGPISFELVGTPGNVCAQFAAQHEDAAHVRRQLQAHFPEAVFKPCEAALEEAWQSSESDEVLVVEFGLDREFMFPVATGKLDAFVGIIGALSELQPGEVGIFQVLFEPAREEWSESILEAVTDSEGKPFFVNFPEVTAAAEHKVEYPLYAAVVRVAAKSETYEGAVSIARDLAGSLGVFANPRGNKLIPLHNEGYPFEDHIEDLLRRQSHRSGMLLNAEELIGFVHLPSSAVRSAAFKRDTAKSKKAPNNARNASGLLLGNNTHLTESVPIRLTPEQRSRHIHVIGASGTGKSTLLFNLIRESIENGEGVAVLDPHGDLVEQILGIIPEGRINDVVLIDPSDEEYSIGFNILSAHSDLEKNLLSSDLVSVFQRLSTSWGDQMGIVLQNAILAFLESNQGGTLSDMRRFLIEPSFREQFLNSVRDPDIVYYWRKAFKELSGNKSIGPVITRLETFLAPKPIRYMVAQSENRIDFGDIMDSGKIFLAKLPQGQIGKENSFLLGSLLVSKFQQLAMSRQAQRIESRRLFTLIIDEFQNFITPSMSEILSGARKYKLGLVLAHQELRQLERDREVASAVLSNPYTRIVFRVGDADARALEGGFSFFESHDLQNLETGQAICRIEKADGDFNISIPFFDSIVPDTARRQNVVNVSRARYGTPRAQVEAAILAKLNQPNTEPSSKTGAHPRHRNNPQAEPKSVPTVSKEENPFNEPKSEPLIAEVTKPVRIESEINVPPKAATAPHDLGRGGEQHKLIQHRVKAAAEKLGYRVTTELAVLDRSGSVDVALEHARGNIAVEITITTTIDHEVGNVNKCLKAGFPIVAVLSTSETKLSQMKSAVESALGPELAARVAYFLPDQFCAHLIDVASEEIAAQPHPLKEKTRRGYKVTKSAPKLTPDEITAKESAALKMIAESMRAKEK